VELIVAFTPLVAAWNLEWKKMERFRPTKRTSGHGKAAPLSHIVGAPSKLGASDKVRVLVGQGLANHPWRVLQLSEGESRTK